MTARKSSVRRVNHPRCFPRCDNREPVFKSFPAAEVPLGKAREQLGLNIVAVKHNYDPVNSTATVRLLLVGPQRIAITVHNWGNDCPCGLVKLPSCQYWGQRLSRLIGPLRS